MYDFDVQHNRLGTHCYKWDIKGKDYIPLWVADTDFQVSPAITARLQKRVDHGFYGYCLTGNEIYDTLVEYFKREFEASVPGREWIQLIPGIVPGLRVASHMWDNKKALTNVPNYSCLLDAPAEAGLDPMVTVPFHNVNERYTIDFEALQKAVTPDTKVFYLCNPHNPTGRVFTLEELRAVSEFAKKNHLLVISDEAHCDIVYEGKHIPFFTVDDYARENSICFYSNGKMYNVPDVILAFAVIPNPSIRQEFARRGFALGEEHILNVEAGVASYGESIEWKNEMLSYFESNRNYFEQELKRRFPKAKFPHMEGTYLQWVDFRGYGDDVNADFFLEHAKVFLTNGADFGDAGYVRVNLATQKEVIRQALDRMETALKDANRLS